MLTIFYDLETTDRNPVGQIINYCFILVDEQYEIIDELSGLIRLSRLQIPDPGAILANRTDVIEHQRIADECEAVALERIRKFIQQCIVRASGAVALAGYNSSRFDLGYLRTSFIRNGINPYFKNQIVPRDLLHVVQKSYLSSESFRDAIQLQRKGEEKLSLSLETVAHALGLLSGVQVHESREDVVLTIDVARKIRDMCGFDVATFEGYEGVSVHSTAGSGAVYMTSRPEYDLSESTYVSKTPMAILDANHKAALWIDLDKYAMSPDRSAIVWRSSAKHAFFMSEQSVVDPHFQDLARRAIRQFKDVSLYNFFEKSSCDIEMDIYRMGFDAQGLFERAVLKNDRSILSECTTNEPMVLWIRRQLASEAASIQDPKTAEVLRKYALHRYGGKFQLAKSISDKNGDYEQYQESLGCLVQRLLHLKEAAVMKDAVDDEKLLVSLEQFIKNSDIYAVAGQDLVPMWAS